MTADLSIFRFDGNDVRTVVIDGEPWFVAADVARVLGYRMASDFTRRLDEDEKGTHSARTPGGMQDVTVVSESGLYVAVIGSQVPAARAFKRWITHEVIPALRRTGTYSTAPALPQSYADALRELASVVEQREVLAAKVAVDAPKVHFAEAVTASNDSILIRHLANILQQNGVDIGQNRLFEKLRNEGYLCKSGSSYNLPTQRAMSMGLFEVIESAGHSPTSTPHLRLTTKVTGKGQQYFVDRFVSREAFLPLPVAS